MLICALCERVLLNVEVYMCRGLAKGTLGRENDN